MRIKGWECVLEQDGKVRAASNTHGGTICWVNGRIIGHCDAPAEVVQWLIRPALRFAWESGTLFRHPNPYAGEPPNKDHEPS